MNYSPSPFRPILQAIADVRATSVTPDNPRGFFGPERRIDTPEGRALFLDRWAKPAAKLGIQGVIVWCPHGYDARGAMYRPDAHTTQALAWMMELSAMLRDIGMWTGTLLRPRYVVVSGREGDRAVRVEATPPMLGHTREVVEAWVSVGVDSFYLDEFGEQLEDARVVQAIRMGGAKHLWMETSCPATAMLAGRYCEEPNVGPWNRPGELDRQRAALPNMDIIGVPRQTETYTTIARRGYRPLVQDWHMRDPDRYGVTAAIKAMTKRGEVDEVEGKEVAK